MIHRYFSAVKPLAVAMFLGTAALALSLPTTAFGQPGKQSKKAVVKTVTKKQTAKATSKSKMVVATRTTSRQKESAKRPIPQRTHLATASHQQSPRLMRAVDRSSSTISRPVQRVSYGQAYGLRNAHDPLELSSSVALVLDQDTNEVLFSKNEKAVLPIASLTKLMTAVVVTEAKQDPNEVLSITTDDIDTQKGSSSRLPVGTQLTRAELLHLALMSSENRAANALGRHYPGGLPALVSAMNRVARQLGMYDTIYVEPTGLSSRNQSSARDLAKLVKYAYRYQTIRELSTSTGTEMLVGDKILQYHTTNRLVKSPEWEIGLQKTGFISEAGRCLVMQARVAGRRLVMVLLDGAGKYSRINDAERLRHWMLGEPYGEEGFTQVKSTAGAEDY